MKYFLTTAALFMACLSAIGQSHFELPAIPDSIKVIEQRASFLAVNYWQNLDMSSSEQAQSIDVEQAFVDFLEVLSLCPPTLQTMAIDNHVAMMVRVDKAWLYSFSDLYEKYLFSPDSPMQNNELMISFLESLSSNPLLDKFDKMRPEYQLEMALKNREGGPITDLSVITRGGLQTSLMELISQQGAGSSVKPQYTMIMFYNPDCQSCVQQISKAQDSHQFLDAAEGGRLRIVALYPGGDAALWRNSRGKIPEQWVDVMAQEPMDQLYDLTTIPTIYLLDQHNKVLLKNTTVDKVIDRLSRKE